MILKGFKFGLLLQIAVGPICVFIFQTAMTSGLPLALTGVVGVALIDTLYILFAILGLGALINKYDNAKKILTYFGALVLVLFGLSIIFEVLGMPLLPSFSLMSSKNVSNVFIKVIILTLSNPLTIVFWAGVFSARLVDEDMIKSDMFMFGVGAILSTLFFLSLIAIIGMFADAFLNANVLNILNIVVGVVLIFFGIQTALKKA
jgi:threonine/homoserine/homoserine lactone efflux protein